MQAHQIWIVKKHTGIAVKVMSTVGVLRQKNICETGMDRWIR